MTDDPNWADIASAVGTCATGVTAVILSWQAYSLEQRRLRHELYPARKEMYKRLRTLKTNIEENFKSQEDEEYKKLTDICVEEIEEIAMQAPALFGFEVSHKLDNLKYQVREFAFFRRRNISIREKRSEEIQTAIIDALDLMQKEFEYKHSAAVNILATPIIAVYVPYLWLKQHFRKFFASRK